MTAPQPLPSPLTGIAVCVFDAYGTLFDVHSAAARERAAIGPDADRLSEIWRRKQLEYTWLLSLMGAHRDFRAVTADALDFAAEAVGLTDRALIDRLMALYLKLDAYPEVPAMLDALRAKGLKTAILSNGEPGMLASAVASAGLGERLDAVLSVEDAGVFKPHPSVYDLVGKRFGVAPQQVCFLSSNAWDAHAAAHYGFRVLWVNRFGQPRERLPGVLAGILSDLAPLPDLVGP